MRISDWSSDVCSSDLRGEVIGTLVQPAQDWEGRHPLPPDAGKGTLDTLSVIAGLGELLQAGGRSEGNFPVFDGGQRYDLIFSDAGERVLEPTSYSISAGPARGRKPAYKTLRGHTIDRSEENTSALPSLIR